MYKENYYCARRLAKRLIFPPSYFEGEPFPVNRSNITISVGGEVVACYGTEDEAEALISGILTVDPTAHVGVTRKA